MAFLLRLSALIDAITAAIGRSVSWLILVAVLVSAINAVVRKIFDMSSNAWLELQWYLFGAVFLLAAAYTLQKNEHIRIDILSSTWSKRTRDIIDLVLHIIFLLPFSSLMVYLSWSWFWLSFRTGEVSANAGGLVIWPAKSFVLIGFILLTAQAFSEIIKRIGVLTGRIEDPLWTRRLPIMPRRCADMLEFIVENLAPIMFTTVMALLVLGYPVAFTLAAGGLAFFAIGVEFSHLSPSINLFWPLLQSHPERIYGIMNNDTLLAIPFFTFMGIILERSRMAEDLLDTIGQLFGPIRGGLAYAVVLVGALLGATTGVVAASVMAMGLISMPIMLRYGYNKPFVSGTIAASGTLAQIVPPSLVLIVMADQLGRSVGDMYVGALYPALLIVATYCAYVFVITLVKPAWAPALPREARTGRRGDVAGRDDPHCRRALLSGRHGALHRHLAGMAHGDFAGAGRRRHLSHRPGQ